MVRKDTVVEVCAGCRFDMPCVRYRIEPFVVLSDRKLTCINSSSIRSKCLCIAVMLHVLPGTETSNFETIVFVGNRELENC